MVADCRLLNPELRCNLAICPSITEEEHSNNSATDRLLM